MSEEYPTERQLKTIQEWDCLKEPVLELLDYVYDIWWAQEWGFVKKNGRTQVHKKKCIKLELHTGGWSGNEDIIYALQANPSFWMLFWQKSVRGGHYYFEIPLHLNKTK